ncbi:MAG: hypothetical protein AB1430_09370 [Pseudomonadota bacterium]
MSAAQPGLEAARQQAQLEFAGSGAELRLGTLAGLPWTAHQLQTLEAGHPAVRQRLDGGLTAQVFELLDGGRRWTLKRARPRALVHNVDGQTSFLNEVQRRIELAALKASAADPARWAALVDTQYASYREGVILSPWIEGEHVQHWDARRLHQLLHTACALWTEGLFEWDWSNGNILDDGRQLRVFDFGYMYRFDPLRHFNSAGHGTDVPLFHPAERFETRNHSGYLLQMELRQHSQAALAAFRLEKQAALPAYQRMRSEIARRGASATVLGWLDGIINRWREGLAQGAEALYFAEQWRSHVLDLDDDLRGRSCTPLTLARADWLLDALGHHFDALQHGQALFWGDEHKTRAALLAQYASRRREAEHYQIDRKTET